MQVTFPAADNHRLANLCGVMDENLRQIEAALNVNIARRGEVFNVGLGERVTILEVIEMIGEAAGFTATPQFAPRRAGDVDHSWADLTKIRRMLGYAPTTPLAPALAAFVRDECAAVHAK